MWMGLNQLNTLREKKNSFQEKNEFCFKTEDYGASVKWWNNCLTSVRS
jgi:hypothetical protein